MEESMWVGQEFTRTIKQMKDNKKYKNTNELSGTDPDIPSSSYVNLGQSSIDDFKTVKVYELEYRNENKKYLLVLSEDDKGVREHYNEESIYKMEEWQYDELTFNKTGHRAFAISDISKIKNLQDRFTATMDSILEQVDKFQPKIAYSGSDLTEQGKNALLNGGIGAAVECTKNPAEVFRELQMVQLKSDLKALGDQIIEIITIQTGLTRAQLTGMAIQRLAMRLSLDWMSRTKQRSRRLKRALLIKGLRR